MNTSLTTIKSLLQQDEVENALSQLTEITKEYPSRYQNEIILHTANFRQIENEKRKGLVSLEEFRREKSRILNALLDFICELERETPIHSNKIIDTFSGLMPSEENASLAVNSSKNSSEMIEIFISYSHKDESLREELDIHLANLKKQGKISAWNDRAIEAGTEWDAEIKAHLESAQIILLLISPPFMASEYCYDLEMQRAMERHQAGTAKVIPIILRPTDWKDTPFSKLQALPKDGKPITTWENQDEAFLNVVQSIRKAINGRFLKD